MASEPDEARFDPRERVRRLPGRGGGAPSEYLDVKWRMVWLRDRFPDSQIETEILHWDERSCLVRATVRRIDADGAVRGTASGHGFETAADFKDYIQKSETAAIGRALNALGYGAESMGDDEAEAGGITNAPVERSVPRPAAVPEPAVVSARPQPARRAPPGGRAPNRFGGVHAAIKAKLGGEDGSFDPHPVAHDLAVAMFGVASLNEVEGEQLYRLRKKVDELDGRALRAEWEAARRAADPTPPARLDSRRGGPGDDRYTNS